MAEKQCAICHKKSQVGGKRKKLRGHYNPTTKVRRKPNLQWTKVPHDTKGFKKGERILACTKCIKAFRKIAAR